MVDNTVYLAKMNCTYSLTRSRAQRLSELTECQLCILNTCLTYPFDLWGSLFFTANHVTMCSIHNTYHNTLIAFQVYAANNIHNTWILLHCKNHNTNMHTTYYAISILSTLGTDCITFRWLSPCFDKGNWLHVVLYMFQNYLQKYVKNCR